MNDFSFTPDDETGLDEVHAHKPDHIHIEYMDNNHVWVGIDMPNGDVWHINFHARGKITGEVYPA